jgi:hypothetical protein
MIFVGNIYAGLSGGGGGGLTGADGGLSVVGTDAVLGGSSLLPGGATITAPSPSFFRMIDTRAPVPSCAWNFFPWDLSVHQNFSAWNNAGTAGVQVDMDSAAGLNLSVFGFGSGTSRVNITPAAFQIQSDTNGKWMVYTSDYSALSSGDPRSIPDLGYVESLVGAGNIVASNKVAGVAVSENLITYAIPVLTPTLYRINASGTIRNALGSWIINFTYTDTSGTVLTYGGYASITAPGTSSGWPPLDIYCNPLTNISIDVVIAGGCIADFAACIERLI